MLAFEATTTLEQGLSETVGWTREQLPRIQRCIERHRDHHVVDF
jgi:hypothetical protein